MGVELYVSEVTEPIAYAFQPVDEMANSCMCFPPFLFRGCNPHSCLRFRIFEIIVHSIVLIYCGYFFFYHWAKDGLLHTARNIFQVLCMGSCLFILARQLYVISLSSYTPSPALNYFLFATELDSSESQMYVLSYTLGPVAALVYALANSAHIKVKRGTVYFIFCFLALISYSPGKIFPALPKNEARIELVSPLGVFGAVTFIVVIVVFFGFAWAVQRKLKRMRIAVSNDQGQKTKNYKLICWRALSVAVLGALVHIVYAQTLFQPPYDFTVDQYVVFRYIKTSTYILGWSLLIYDFESGLGGRQDQLLCALKARLGWRRSRPSDQRAGDKAHWSVPDSNSDEIASATVAEADHCPSVRM